MPPQMPPVVTDVTSAPISGTAGIGSQIVLTLTTDRAVTVDTAGGTPSLSLSNGGTAVYTGVDGSGRPQFTYMVAAGDTATSGLTVTGLALNGGSIGGGGLSFAAKVDFATGSNPQSVTLADVNGDGRLDIVTANSSSSSASVLLGDGNGTFNPRTEFVVGSGARSLVLADVNGDTRLDIVTANLLGNNTSVLLGNGNGTFKTRTAFATGNTPYSVAVADLNSDNMPDIVTANSTNDTASVLLGNGNGTFEPKTDLATGVSPASVVLVDIDGDTKLDIVTANSSGNSASVLLGNGNGTFKARTDFAADSGARSVAVADVDGDGRLDIVTANLDAANASVLLGNSNGTFKPKTDFATDIGPYAVKLADVDRDGALDIVVGYYSGTRTSVLLGNGDGTFKAKTDFTTGSSPGAVALADLNGDGKLDIATANSSVNSTSVLLNITEPTSILSTASVTSATGAVTGVAVDATRPTLVSATVNGRALVLTYSEALDAAHGPIPNAFTVMAASSAVSVSSLAVNGTAKTVTLTLASAVAHGQTVTVAYADMTVGDDAFAIQDAAGNDAESLAATSVTNNTPVPDTTPPVIPSVSIPDAAMRIGATVTATITVTADADTYTLQSGTIAGYTLGSLTKVDDSTYTATFTVTAGSDVAASADLPVSLVLKDGAGNLSTAYTTAISQNADPIDATRPTLVSATVDGATLVLTYGEALDAAHGPAASAFTVRAGGAVVSVSGVAVDEAAKTVTLTLASPVTVGQGVTVAYADPTDGNDAFAIQDKAGNDAESVSATIITNQTPIRVTAVTANPTSRTVGIGTRVVLTLSTELPVKVDITGGRPSLILGNGATAAYTGVDRNGKLQFAYTVAAGDGATSDLTVTGIALNGSSITGGGMRFAAQADLATGLSPFGVASADLDGDGKLDLVTANMVGSSVSVHLGNGNGTFKPRTDLATGTSSRSVALRDVNGDGKLDIVSASSSGNTIPVFLGNGNGTFKPRIDVAIDAPPFAVALEDLNGDGKLDIVTINQNANSASVLLGNGNGTFKTKTSFGIGTTPYAVALADIDGDTTIDIVTANSASNTVSVLLGNGNGTFKPRTDHGAGTAPYAVALADIDGDGTIDIVTANSSSNTVSVLLGNGNGTFKTKTDFGTGTTPYSVAVADIDGDGKLDIGTANTGSNTASVLLGNGDGTFKPKTDFAAGASPVAVALADVDGDGRSDIFTANFSRSSASVLLNSIGPVVGASVTSAATGLGIDATRPTLVSATVNGTALVLTYSEALDATKAPGRTAFTVMVDGSSVEVSTIVLNASAKTATLTLASAVAHGQSVTVAYADPTNGNDAFALQDSVGNDVESLSATSVTNTPPVSDTTPPAITSVSIPDTAMKIGDTVTATITVTADTDTYTLQSGTIGGYTLGSLTKVDDTTYKATFTVTAGLDVAASAALPVSLVLKDAAGNLSTAYTTAISQSSDAIDATRPTLVSATVDGTALVLTYDELLDATHGPVAGDFTVTAAGSAVTVSSVAVDATAKTVTLTLASAVTQGQTVTVAYADPTGSDDINAIQDTAGNDAATLSATSVTNTTSASGASAVKFIFQADDGINGGEFWVSDGTASGTTLLKDIAAGSNWSSPSNFVDLGNGKAVFTANDSIHNKELWITDGAANGTMLLKDIVPGQSSSYLNGLTGIGNGKVLFQADNEFTGFELWITDGTATGTALVKNINPGSNPSFPNSFTALGNGKAVFVADDGVSSSELWVSDGTATGTALVKDIAPGTDPSFPTSLTAVGNGQVIFTADDGTSGKEVWITDGTANGTTRITDIGIGAMGASASDFTALGNGKVVFSADDGTHGDELWITDGTANGTMLVKDIYPGSSGSSLYGFTALGNGKLIFSADDGTNGQEVWFTDGTANGTTRITDIAAGSTGSAPSSFTALGDGRILFSAYDTTHGTELWMSDGTANGTTLVKDIAAGVGSSFPSQLTALGNGKAAFQAKDAANGIEVWITDGTVNGTTLLKDVAAGTASSYPSAFTLLSSPPRDTTPPTIAAVSIPNMPAQVGDTVTVTIAVTADGDSYTLGTGSTVDGFALGGLTKVDDTTYTAIFAVTADGLLTGNRAANQDIPVNIILVDGASNASPPYTTAISQTNDRIDTNALPFLATPTTPPTLIDTAAPDTFPIVSGQLSAADLEGSTLTYSIEGSQASPVQHGSTTLGNGVTYDTWSTGPGGTAYVDSQTGQYAYVFDAAFLNGMPAASLSGTSTFTVSDGNRSVSKQITLNFTGANDSPILSNDTRSLPGIDQGIADAANTGATVKALLASAGTATDAEHDSPVPLVTVLSLGIAVTGVTNANGVWQAKVGGGAWADIPAGSSNGSALLLAASDRVRFVPSASGFVGTETGGLTFKAWDRTSGTAGSTADTTGASAFSLISAAATIAVDALPTLTATGGSAVFGVGASAPTGLFSGVVASTVEAGQRFHGAMFTVSGVVDATEVLSIGGTDIALIGGTQASLGGLGAQRGDASVAVTTVGRVTIVTVTGLDRDDAQMSALLGNVAYKNTSGAATLGDRTVTLANLTDSGSATGPAFITGASTVVTVADVTAPTAPAITSAALSGNATPTLSGTAEAGATVTVTVGGTTYATTATAGTWSLDLATATPATGALGLDLNGSNAVSATAKDAAGNVSAVGTQALVIDTTAPGAPAVTSAALSNKAAPTLTGTAEANATVTVMVGGATYATTATAGTWSLDLATATPATGTLGLDTNGSNAVSVTAKDLAGNVSAAGTQALVIDTTAPGAPAVTSAALTNSATPTLSGTAEAGATVTVTVGGATYATTATAGTWTIDLATATPGTGTLGLDLNGSNTVSVIAKDAAGNVSTTGTQALVIDTSAPGAPAVTSAALTNSATPTLTGTAETGATVTVTVGGATYATTATAGTWTIDLATATPATGALGLDTNGSNAVSVTAKDAAGNVSTTGTLSLVIDTSAPGAPAITSAALTNSATPTLTGTASAGSTVTVTVGGATYATTATAGTWSLDLATATPGTGTLGLDTNGSNAVSVTAKDLAGNVSAAGTQSLVIDTTAPSATIRFEDADIGASGQTDAAFLVTSLEPGDSFTWTIASTGGGQISGQGTTSAGSTRVGGLDLSGLADGTLTLTLGLTDPAGNAAAPVTAAARKATATNPDPVTPPKQTIDGATVDTSVTTAPHGSRIDTVTIAATDAGRVEDSGTANADLADVPVVRETLIDPQTGQPTSLATLTVSVPTGVGVVATGNAGRQTPDQALTGLIAAIQARTGADTTSQADLTGGGSGFLGGLSSQAQLLVRAIDIAAPGVTPGQPVQMRVNGNTLNGTGSTTPTALVFDTTAVASPVTIRLDNVEFAAVVGNATLVGGDGRQVVYGDTSQQYLYLGADDDELHGGGGNDTVASAGGNDTLYGDAGEDLVAGGEGDDWLHGGTGRDTVFGETGNDVVFGQDDDDFIGAGSGNDFASGGSGNDEVHGEDGDDVLFGDEGRDGIYGGAGDDRAHGGTGDDFMQGGTGRDTVFGETGNDAVLGQDDDDFVGAGSGNDFASGGSGNDEVHGEDGDDLLFGDEGNDGVYGGAGDDWAYGGTGNDVVLGGEGRDVVFGQDGDDLVRGDAGDDFVSGGYGRDLVEGGSGNDLVYGDDDDDVVLGGEGDDAVFGGTGNDLVSGEAGDDRVAGEQGNDTLLGGAGGDGLSGGEGDDLLFGGDGSDLLFGNVGSDTLEGGLGSDVFGFGRWDGSDVIRDVVVAGPEADVIAFNGGVVESFAALQGALTQVGSDTVIRYGAGDVLTLQNVQASSLSAANFTFA